jgi:hypothetical protein
VITAGDIRWLAGLLEGEGSFMPYKGNPRIALSMTDLDVVVRAAVFLHGAVNPIRDKRSPRRKILWQTCNYGANAVGWMMTLYPVMGQRRRARIREVIAAWKAKTTGSATSHPRAVWRRADRWKAAA